MKLKISLLSLFTIMFFMNCGQSAQFDAGDERFKSLMDGETVEVVPDSEINQGDGGIAGDLMTPDSGTNSRDGGTSTGTDSPNNGYDGGYSSDDDDDDAHDFPGSSGNRYANIEGTDGDGKKRSCRDRILEQDKKNKHDEMETSPEEMESDETINRAVACGDNGKKVLVCHFPNADYSKRKTLCIGAPALQAHIAHLGNKRGSEHVDYAGPCKD